MNRWLLLTAFFFTASCLTCSTGDSEDRCSAQSEAGIGPPGAAMLQSAKLLHIQTEEEVVAVGGTDTDTDRELEVGQDTSKSKAAMRSAMIIALNGKATALRYHKMLLDRSIASMDQAMTSNDPTGSLEDLVGDFINNQATAQDSCPAQLLEAKRQLTALHYQVRDLAAEVNATETEETVDIVELRNVQVEMGKIEDSTPGKHGECKKQHEEDMKTYLLLKKELQEMWTIANPTVKMDVRTAYKRFLKEQENRSKKVTKIVTYKRGPTEIFNVTENETEKYAKWSKTYYNESANRTTNAYGNISTNTEFDASKTYKDTYDVIHHSNFTKSSHTTTGDGEWSNWSSLAMEYAAPNISFHTTVYTSTLAPIEINLSAGDAAFDKDYYLSKGWTVTETSPVRVEALMKNLLYQLLLDQVSVKGLVESALKTSILAVKPYIGHPEMTEMDVIVKLVKAYQAEDTVAQILIPPSKDQTHNDMAVEISKYLFEIASQIEGKILNIPGIAAVSTATIVTDAHVVTDADYVADQIGSITCGGGSVPIVDKGECQIASGSLGFEWGGEVNAADEPSTCIKRTSGQTFFNLAVSGVAKAETTPICKEVPTDSSSLLQANEEKLSQTQAVATASSFLQEEEVEKALSETPPKPALTSVSSSLGLASKAKSLAGVLAECMASHGMEGHGSLLQEDSDEMQGPGLNVCPASDITVELDGAKVILSTDKELKVGESQGAKCHDVNEKFSGEIILLCKSGFIQPDMTGCQPQADSGIAGSGDEWAGKKCTTKQGIKARIQGATVTFHPTANISSGGLAYKQCSDINANFTGEIILNCKDGLIRPDISGCVPPKTPESEACEQQKLQLEITYSRAYVELTRLVSEYEQIINSTACDDAVDADEDNSMKPLKVKVETLTKEIRYITEHTRSYRIQLHDMKKAEAKLTMHVAVLRKKCETLDETISSLDKVRDAIHVISLCPGLEPAQFSVPTYLGILHANFDNTYFTDEQIDMEMNALCAHEQKVDGPKPRAAETSEIHLKAILNAPVTNPEAMPLWGTCPQCAGEDDDTSDPDAPKHKSGHARICWNEGKELILSEARHTCSKGRKAVMCVEDRADPSKGQYTPPPGGWNWNDAEWTVSGLPGS